MSTVVILTNKNEVTCDPVIEILDKNGQNYIRINTEDLPENELSINHNDSSQQLNLKLKNGKNILLDDIHSVWNRHPEKPLISKGIREQDIEFSNYQWRAFLWSFYNSIQAPWMNSPQLSRLIEHNKLYQMREASKAGLLTPRTIITNDTDKLIKFTEDCGGVIAIKTLRPTLVNIDQDGDGFIYTNKVNVEDIKKYKRDIRLVPVFAQEYIKKLIELRVTVIKDSIFSCAIYSQEKEHSKHDWRKHETHLLNHEVYDLSDDTRNKIIKFMELTNLVYGAFDLILTPDNNIVFLEVNPSGQWLWIEKLTNLPISQSIAEFLINPT